MFRISKTKNKKYDVKVNGKWISFGDKRYEHFEDKALGSYSNLNHFDKKRRANFRARVKGIKLKDGTPAYLNKNSPAYWSYHYLW